MSEDIRINLIENKLFHNEIDKIVVTLHNRKKKNSSKVFMMNGVGAASGVTTVIENLGAALARSEWKTVILDCDFRKVTSEAGEDKDTNLSLADILSAERSR